MTAVGEAQAQAEASVHRLVRRRRRHRWTQLTLLLLGDPELRICTGAAAHAGGDASGIGRCSATATLAVTCTIGGSPLDGRARHGVQGERRVSDRHHQRRRRRPRCRSVPTAWARFTLTVTAFNARPYQAVDHARRRRAGARRTSLPVIDNERHGTAGNSDGQFDAGETVDLRIPVKNTGGATANTVTGTLTTTEPHASRSRSANRRLRLDRGRAATKNAAIPFRVIAAVTRARPARDPLQPPARATAAAACWNETRRGRLRAPELVHPSARRRRSRAANANGRVPIRARRSPTS